MADNAITVAGIPVASKDRGGTQWQLMLDGNAAVAAVVTAAVGTSSTSPAIAADATSRRQILIINPATQANTVEISPTASFALGQGFPLAPGDSISVNYNGAIYARVATGTGELRAWSEG